MPAKKAATRARGATKKAAAGPVRPKVKPASGSGNGTAPEPEAEPIDVSNQVIRFAYDGHEYAIPVDIGELPAGTDRRLFIQSEGLTIGQVWDELVRSQTSTPSWFLPHSLLFIGIEYEGGRANYQAIEDSFDTEKWGHYITIDELGDAAPEA